jgi:AraC-like DNA-binding protein
MTSQLDRIKDWNSLAAECNYRVDAMARKGGVSARTLRRYFHEKFGTSPKAWVDVRRLEGAMDEISNGSLVKTAAADFYFKQRSHLWKVCKRITGKSPTKYVKGS